MAVTHADLAPSRRSTDLGSKTGALLTVLSILLGLVCFILCLIAEATRSQVSWLTTSGEGGESKHECTYSGSGKSPLLCGAGAFFALAMAMMVEHTYLLLAITKSTPPALLAWDPQSNFAKALTLQAAFFFVSTWVTFAVGEILLLIGLSVESGHLKNWESPRLNCLIIGQGVFAAAGVFGLATVFLAAGLYITALRAQRVLQDHANFTREVLEASVLYASPPRTPQRVQPTPNENPVARETQNEQQPLSQYLKLFDKHLNLV